MLHTVMIDRPVAPNPCVPFFRPLQFIWRIPLLSHRSPEHLSVGPRSSESDAMICESKLIVLDGAGSSGLPQKLEKDTWQRRKYVLTY